EGDACVVALGVVSTPLLRPLGIRLPVYPLKGYSVTLPVEESGADVAPSMAITDNERKMVYSRLGNRLRAAGLADLGEVDANLRPERIVQIAREVQALFPHCIGMEKAMFWTGLRPATPDGIPVLGPSGIDGLYLNSGHGTLGWTLSAGSASVLAHVVEGKPSPITLDGLTLSRFR
ncbi:MAG: FAD-dependent oxidoreductase, partial [Alphaproteobacteria bacterium]|nr:FAD-dependent oxidoreductase [Alphaproteobacteria bacterium]